jgi:chaperonin GroES
VKNCQHLPLGIGLANEGCKVKHKFKKYMSVTLKPIAGTQNRVIVQAAPAEEKTASGIIIPDTAKEKPQRGTVISVSEVDEKGNKPAVKVGDTVLYGKYAGTEISVDGTDYLIMRESDIFATI